jgi:G3E family GTPase
VDAVKGGLHLNLNPELTKQIMAADAMVLTKMDVVEAGAAGTLRTRIRGINPSTRVLKALFGRVDSGDLLRPMAGWFLAGPAPVPKTLSVGSGTEDGNSLHVSRTHSASLTLEGPVDWAAFGIWFSMLLYARGEEVLRVKGFIDVGEAGLVLLNGVQHVVRPPDHLREWPNEDHHSRVVFITRHPLPGVACLIGGFPEHPRGRAAPAQSERARATLRSLTRSRFQGAFGYPTLVRDQCGRAAIGL